MSYLDDVFKKTPLIASNSVPLEAQTTTELSADVLTELSKMAKKHGRRAKVCGTTDVETLTKVYQRGLTASADPMDRVNNYIYLLVKGSPAKADYTVDNDLLPAGHPLAK